MNPERWARLRACFDSIVILPSGHWESRLQELVPDDEELCKELRGLLSNFTNSQESPFSRWTPVSTVPDEVGGYRITRALGSGGMGIVYEACSRGDIDRRVAIKLIKRGMDSHGIVERFRRERRILALLEHPSITRLYDAGVTADGQPYFVMEYVEGARWDQAMAARSLRERVQLLIAVCLAVEYAHQRLILHRDLKPSNLMVLGGGEIKLLDFGAARLLTADPDHTIAGLCPFTPKYASPEVRAGLPATVAADIYSLGVMLQELLEPGAGADARAIAERATGEDAASRYASVSAMRLDLERYLRHEPVEAHQGNLAYRVRKMVRRHGMALAAACVTLAIGTVGLVATLREADRARAAQLRAEKTLASLRALSREFMTTAAVAARQDPDSRNRLLTQTLPYVREVLLAKYPPDLLSSFDLICGLTQAAQRQRPVDQACGAIFSEALERATAAKEKEPSDELWLALAVSRALADQRFDAEATRWAEHGLKSTNPSLDRVMLMMDLANIESRRDRWDRAETLLAAALLEWQSLKRPSTRDAEVLLRLAWLFTQTGADDDALFVLEQMLARDRREPYGPVTRVDLYSQLSRHAKWRGRYTDAVAFAAKSVEILGTPARDVRSLAHAANLRHRLADNLLDAGRRAEAIHTYREAYRYAQLVEQVDSYSMEGPTAVNIARLKLAEGLIACGQPLEALSHLDAVIPWRMARWRALPSESFLTRDAAYALGLRLRALADAGRPQDAIGAGREVLAVLQEFLAPPRANPTHLNHAIEIHRALATLEENLGRPEGGVRHRQEALRLEANTRVEIERRKGDRSAQMDLLRPVLAEIAAR